MNFMSRASSSSGKLHEENQRWNADFMFSLLVNFGI